VIACLGVLIAPAAAKTTLVVLPPDYSGDKAGADAPVVRWPAGTGDRILIYASSPPTLLATITRPDDPSLNRAAFKARLAAQFAPVRMILPRSRRSGRRVRPEILMIPTLLDETGGISSEPSRKARRRVVDRRADLFLRREQPLVG